MIFLDTTDAMKFAHYENYNEVKIDIEDYMFDLTPVVFEEEFRKKVLDSELCNPCLITFNFITEDKEIVDAYADQIMEHFTSFIKKQKTNNDWQPRTQISSELNLTIKAQTNLLNYVTEPNIINVRFLLNTEEIYRMIRKEK